MSNSTMLQTHEVLEEPRECTGKVWHTAHYPPVAWCLQFCPVNLYISIGAVVCNFRHTLDTEHPQFTYGVPEEHLKIQTKEQRYWIRLFFPAKPPSIQRDSGSSKCFFHVSEPREFCATGGKPRFYLLLSCSKTFSSKRPTSVCFCHC